MSTTSLSRYNTTPDCRHPILWDISLLAFLRPVLWWLTVVSASKFPGWMFFVTKSGSLGIFFISYRPFLPTWPDAHGVDWNRVKFICILNQGQNASYLNLRPLFEFFLKQPSSGFRDIVRILFFFGCESRMDPGW